MTLPAVSRLSTTDALRRGFDNAIANWQLIAMRLAETFLFGVIAIGAVIAIIVPMAVSAGISKFDIRDTAAADAVLRSMFGNWMILVWIFLLVLILLVVFALIHSFVIAGVARVLVDGERAAGARPASRTAFGVFSIDRWVEGAKESWWPVFWIYNGAYGLVLLLLCIPPVLILLGMILLKENPAAVIGGCLLLVVFFFLCIVAMVIAGVWCQKAIVVAAEQRCGGARALTEGWAAIRADLGRHFGVAIITLVIAVGGAGVMSAFGIVFGLTTAAIPHAAIVFLPLRFLISIVQSAFGSAVGNWSLASFAALGNDRAGA